MWLLVKDHNMINHAKEVFKDTSVFITSEGRPVLCSPLGTDHFIAKWVEHRVAAWVTELGTLIKFLFSNLKQPTRQRNSH